MPGDICWASRLWIHQLWFPELWIKKLLLRGLWIQRLQTSSLWGLLLPFPGLWVQIQLSSVPAFNYNSAVLLHICLWIWPLCIQLLNLCSITVSKSMCPVAVVFILLTTVLSTIFQLLLSTSNSGSFSD